MHIKDFFLGKKYYQNQFLFIWTLSIFGNLFLIFLSSRIHELPILLSLLSFTLFTLFYGLATKIGVKLVNKTDLNSLKPHNFIKTDLIPALSATAIAIVSIFILSKVLIKIPVEDITFLDSSPVWAKIISSLYCGLNLEILFRLFLLTFIYFILRKLFKDKKFHRWLIWIAIIISAVAPMAINFISSDHLTLVRLFILNIVGGIVYGYLFVYKSFYAAAIAHFLVEYFLNGI